MLEKRWRSDVDTQVLRGVRRGGSVGVAETMMLDVRDFSPSSWSTRRSVLVGPADVADDREALAATALAAYQASASAPSVLDVDAHSLRIPRIRLRQEPAKKKEWAPPACRALDTVEEQDREEGRKGEALRRAKARRRRSRRVVVASFVGAGIVGLLGGSIFFTMTEREGEAMGALAAASAPSAASADPATAEAAAGESIVNVEGLLEVTELDLRSGVEGGWGDPATSFTPDQPVSAWISFDYTGAADATHRLSVAWYRGDAELARPSFELTSSAQGTAIAAPPLTEPGAYRADLMLNDEVITSLPFEVTGPTDVPPAPEGEQPQG